MMTGKAWYTEGPKRWHQSRSRTRILGASQGRSFYKRVSQRGSKTRFVASGKMDPVGGMDWFRPTHHPRIQQRYRTRIPSKSLVSTRAIRTTATKSLYSRRRVGFGIAGGVALAGAGAYAARRRRTRRNYKGQFAGSY